MADDVSIAIGARDNASAVLNKIAGSVGSLSSTFAALGPVAIGIGAAVAGVTAAFSAMNAVVSGISETANKIDDLSDVARGLGESVGSLQEFQFAMQEAGNVSAEKSIDTLRKIQKVVGEIATGGNEKGGEVFKKLGIDAGELSLQGPIAQFVAIQQAIQSVENASERAAIAQSLLGKSAGELLPAFMANADAMRESEEFARKVGVALSDTEASAVANMNDAVDRMGLAFEGIYTSVAVQLAPIIEQIALTAVDWLVSVKEIADVVLPIMVDHFVFLADSGIEFAKALGLADQNAQSFTAQLNASREAAAETARELELQRSTMASINATADKAADKAAEQSQKEYEQVIAALERRFAVAQMSEQWVKAEEELATARNDLERERIELLQEQLFKQEQLNKAAEDKVKEDEKAAKEKEKIQDLIARVPQSVQATESRLLTRGPVDTIAANQLAVQKKQEQLQNRIAAQLEKTYELEKSRGRMLGVEVAP